MVEIFDPQARLEHIIQVAVAAKRFSQHDHQGSLAFFPRTLEFYHEGIFASGIFSLCNEQKTVLIFLGEESGYFHPETRSLLGRNYGFKKSDFGPWKKWLEQEVSLDLHFELLFPYLQLLKNINQIAVIQITQEDVKQFWKCIDKTILQEYNLIFCENLHSKLPLEEGLQKDSELLEAIKQQQPDSLMKKDFPLLRSFCNIMQQEHFSLINEQYLNTGLLGLDKANSSGYAVLNAGYLL